MKEISVLLKKLLSVECVPLPVNKKRSALDWGKDRPSFGGVYIFWWRDGAQSFHDLIQNKSLHFCGPKGESLEFKITPEILINAKNQCLPLYVGKTAGDIAKRVGLHLKLKTERTVGVASVNGICERMTTSCQVRDRLDRLFPNYSDTRDLALENLAWSYIELDSFVERFFLEDLAIGTLRPIFNIDSER